MAEDQDQEKNTAGTLSIRTTSKRKKVLPNKVESVRIYRLGLKRTEFVAGVQATDPTLVVSTETLKKVERNDKGSEATKTKVLKAINKLLAQRGEDAVTREYLFSPEDIPLDDASHLMDS